VGLLSGDALTAMIRESYDRLEIERTTIMSTLDSLLERNKSFAARESPARTLAPLLPQALPNVRAIIIGCADMRVDPAHILGIKPGEAVVIRNIGGRITPGLLEQLGLLGRIGEVAGAIPGGGGEFHIIVLQHTDCGITRLAGDPLHADGLFSNAGRGTQDKSGHRSARGGCRRCRKGLRFAKKPRGIPPKLEKRFRRLFSITYKKRAASPASLRRERPTPSSLPFHSC
jgi:hypothetical protein